MAGPGKAGRGRGAPRHREHNAPGGPRNPFGQRPDKSAIVAKLSAAARKAGKDAPAPAPAVEAPAADRTED
jgi:hypothetical protein